MSKVRYVQAAVVVLLLVAAWIGVSHVRKTSERAPLVKWIPAGSIEAVSLEMEDVVREARQAPVKMKLEPECPPPPCQPVYCVPAEQPEQKPEPQPEKKPEPEKEYRPAGGATLRGIAGLIISEKASFLGYSANDLLLGKIFENGANRQLGELDLLRPFLAFITDKAKPAAESVIMVRQTLVESDLQKWWFPKAETPLADGAESLLAMSAAVEKQQVRLPGDPKTLIHIIEMTSSRLAAAQNLLVDDELAAGEADNRFFHAQGVALAARTIIQGALEDFPQAISDKGAAQDLGLALTWLDRASRMSPDLFMGGSLDRLAPLQLLTLAYALEMSEDHLQDAVKKLQGKDAVLNSPPALKKTEPPAKK